LAAVVQTKLCVKWSPEQISDHLATTFPDRAEMQVSPETIYQALYVQGRGHLRADLHQHLRTGRAVRRPRRSTAKGPSGKIPDMILISQRPAEVADRAVPGHWEGDLILGSNCRSAIATLVERQTRYAMLVHLPQGHGAIAVRDGLLATIKTLPEHLRKTLTWDQGTELAQHALLRQYFLKGTDLSVHSPERLLEVPAELNDRPRKTLGGIRYWDQPQSSPRSRQMSGSGPGQLARGPSTGSGSSLSWVRPTLPMASKSSRGRPPMELMKIVVTDSAMATIAHTG
jgi:IS30 family transposase